VSRGTDDASPLLAFDQNFDGAVGQAQQLDHRPSVPTSIDVVFSRIIGLGVALRRQQDRLLLVHRLFERLDRLLAPDEERNHHVREDNDIREWQSGNFIPYRRPALSPLSFRKSILVPLRVNARSSRFRRFW
jgi:hypothetical protein